MQTGYDTQAAYATVDWTVAETLIALDQPPLAVGDVKSYQTWVIEPQLPKNTIDLGVRLQPNAERIAALSHSFKSLTFIHSQFYAALNEKLAPYGKVYNVDFYKEGNAWENVVAATQKIGDIIGKPQAAQQLLSQYQKDIDHYRPLLQPFTDRPIALVQFIDTRHLRIYGENSLLGEVIRQLGFKNAYTAQVNNWGFQNIDITELAKLPSNTRFVVIKPYPSHIATALTHNTLWQRLPLAKSPLILPAVWTFGALPSAQRFIGIFAHGLLQGGEQW
ncbi:iron-siderophore ABC transporter substrate-binding protein [Rodentibacter trehalosifermentans]|uniref:Iron ABC transporter substrate-binding protein n=1 Tax=Rodentibacter trehalosifermentans TaxID=1908263 RepID=A0A1V3IZ91_9PAST|nr:iron-siderophore ABC transporter substrate-binding protein [Rodentibacter trehalosifermentans]OOF47358.1 iron ABC transporter substrate-binding protein [Rodentibacter trehalosifermentans]OOF49074.1 iron ABC transporter substrate-binding protein [Rodentibacter trehalosifermentans]OOF52881.1 iron ABC transporter substrate-binding protein [Rodentibacter trehalosifermentans]